MAGQRSLMPTIRALPLPGYWLLAYSLLLLAVAALVIAVALAGILVGRVIALGVKLGLGYWSGD